MAKAKRSEIIQGTEKEFLDVFNRLCYSRSSWQVWADLISAIACTLSNVTDRTQKHFEAREKGICPMHREARIGGDAGGDTQYHRHGAGK